MSQTVKTVYSIINVENGFDAVYSSFVKEQRDNELVRRNNPLDRTTNITIDVQTERQRISESLNAFERLILGLPRTKSQKLEKLAS